MLVGFIVQDFRPYWNSLTNSFMLGRIVWALFLAILCDTLKHVIFPELYNNTNTPFYGTPKHSKNDQKD